MKIFISWSGERSGIIAKALSSWLPNVIQSIEIFYSPNIEKGSRGGDEINATLAETSFGIICLTRDNLQNKWIHYEAGALAKINNDKSRVWTLLNGLDYSDVVQPLAQFQHTVTEKEDVYRLVESINSHTDKPLSEVSLLNIFEKWWSDFEIEIKKAERVTVQTNEKGSQKPENIRDDREILNEILDLLRNQNRQSTPSSNNNLVNYIRLNINVVSSTIPEQINIENYIISSVKQVFNINPTVLFRSKELFAIGISLIDWVPADIAKQNVEILRDQSGLAFVESYYSGGRETRIL
ncbi:MAG TPA: hypothetical protein VF556_17645 [Pyrinomonadaceae bacterium]|jgi:hypothetical protein